MSLDWTTLLDMLRAGDRFLITSHIRPDCDALGSELGLAKTLESMGKSTIILNSDPTPNNISFIDPEGKIQILGKHIKADAIPAHDCFVVVDTSAWAQLGQMAEVMKASTATKIVIDHHQSSDDLGAVEFKDVDCEATGRLITELAEHAGVALSEEIAAPLLAALMTDTGWLRFPSVSAGTYQTTARLVAAGANPSRLYGQLYEQESLPQLILRGLAATRMTATDNERIVYSFILNGDFADTGAPRTATENCVNQGLRVAATEATFFLVEQEKGGFKVSLRSRGKADCSKIAEQLGGGGHRAAAGAFVDTPSVDVAIERVLEVLRPGLDG